MIEHTNPRDDTSARPAPAASLESISIPLRRPRSAPVAAMPSAGPAPLAVTPPKPTNDDEPPAVARRFPSAARHPDEPLTGTGILRDSGTHMEPAVAPSAVIDLWEHLAASRLRPRITDLDAVTIARQWPNSLLLRVTESGRRPVLEVAHMFVPTAGGVTSAIPIDAMTVDWIVALSREVVTSRTPVHETDAVPTARGAIQCGVIALPFGPESGVDHVLCHLYRVDEDLIEAGTAISEKVPPRDRTGIRRLFGR